MSFASSLLASRGLACTKDDLYENDRIGVSLTKPPDWHYVSSADYQDGAVRQVLKDSADSSLEELIRREHELPVLIARARPPDVDDDFYPYFGLWAEPVVEMLEGDDLPASSAKELLGEALAGWKLMLDEFETTASPTSETAASGRAAIAGADWKFRYRLEDGRAWTLQMRSLLALRPPFLLTVHLGASEGQERSALRGIEQSIRM